MPWAVAAAAVAAGGSVYAADKQSKAMKGTSEPGYLIDAERSALDRGKEISTRPYTPYTGQRVADLSQNEKEASQLARTGADQSRSAFDKAGAQLDRSTQEFGKEALDKYTNPYIESVLKPQLREQNQAYDSALGKLKNSKAGARGGDRSAILESQLTKNHMQQLTDVTGKTYADAYDQATRNFFADSDRATRAAQAYQSLGGDVARMNTQQIQDLMATGGTERLLRQADLDFDLQQFTEARDWDANNMKPLLNAIAASKGGNMTQTDYGESGAWGQALGAAATVAGAYFTGGSSLSKSEQKQIGSGAYANGALNDAGFGASWKTPAIQTGG